MERRFEVPSPVQQKGLILDIEEYGNAYLLLVLRAMERTFDSTK